MSLPHAVNDRLNWLVATYASMFVVPSRMPCSNRTSEWTHPEVSEGVSNILQSPEWTLSNRSPSCQCSTSKKLTMMPICPPGAGGMPPSQRIEATGDTLLNLTGRNISDYLVKTYPSLIKTRWVQMQLVDDAGKTYLKGLWQKSHANLHTHTRCDGSFI